MPRCARRRDEVVVATKFAGPTGQGPYAKGASRRYIVRGCEASLRRLATDYIDLYYQHYPDPDTPIEETLLALDDLVHAGKVRYLASSNFAGWQLAEAHHTARELHTQGFVGTQVEWSLLARQAEQEIVPACRHYGLGVLPYFPLAAGLLTGKYRRGAPYPEGSRLDALPYFARFATESNFDKVEALQGFVAERRPFPARAGRLLAGGSARRRKRPGRRHPPGSGQGQRGGCRLGPGCRRPRRRGRCPRIDVVR